MDPEGVREHNAHSRSIMVVAWYVAAVSPESLKQFYETLDIKTWVFQDIFNKEKSMCFGNRFMEMYRNLTAAFMVCQDLRRTLKWTPEVSGLYQVICYVGF